MRLIVDQQLPPVLAEWLRSKGFDAVHVREIGLSDRPDHDIWKQATRDGGVIVTRDADFANFARQDPAGRLVWLRVGNCTNAALIAVFKAEWPAIQSRLDAGATVVEIRP